MDTPTCNQKHCNRPVARRLNGEFYRNCAKCRARLAAWQRRREADRVASGNCRSCGAPCKPKPDGILHDRCDRCRTRRTRRADQRQKHGQCSCGRLRDRRPDGKLYFRCATCRAARAKRKAQLIEAGGCPRCHYRQRAEGDTLCSVCRELAAVHAARKRELEKARGPRHRNRRPTLAYSKPAGPHLPAELVCTSGRCNRRRDEKPDGTLYAHCPTCRDRRKRRRAELVAMGGCTKCGYRQRVEGDTMCAPCRIAKDAHNAEAKELRRLAREIDAWAAKPERGNYQPTPEDCGISRWNSRKPREPSPAYWSPLPDPKPAEPGSYRYNRKFRRC